MCQILQGTCNTKKIKSFFVDLKAKFSLISCILFGNSTHYRPPPAARVDFHLTPFLVQSLTLTPAG